MAGAAMGADNSGFYFYTTLGTELCNAIQRFRIGAYCYDYSPPQTHDQHVSFLVACSVNCIQHFIRGTDSCGLETGGDPVSVAVIVVSDKFDLVTPYDKSPWVESIFHSIEDKIAHL
jgi:hypothetical protein